MCMARLLSLCTYAALGTRHGINGNSFSCGGDVVVQVSGTGIGEQFQRHCVAHDVHARMAYGGLSAQDAAHQVRLW